MLAALVVYASLYPFVGWRWPQGMAGADWLLLPWPRERLRFDELSNFLGYVPIGALLVIAVRRGGGGRGLALAVALGLSAALSYGVELAQQFLPPRVPSAKDCMWNLGGAVVGAAVAMAIDAAGYLEQWHGIRLRWFERDSAWAFLLLLLWPVALLFPAPAPLALGHVWGEVHGWLQAALADTPWAVDALPGLPAAAEPLRALTRLQEVLITGLGLLAPLVAGGRRGGAGGGHDDDVDRAQLRRRARGGLVVAAHRAGAFCRGGAGAGAGGHRLALGRGARCAGAGVVRRAGRPGAERSVLRRQPGRLGAGPAGALSRPGAVGRLVVAVWRDGVVAGASRAARP
jgi:VanZ family protein